MSTVIFQKMAVVGCGLIGSSVIRAARAASAVGTVAVADASAEHRAEISRLGYADLVTDDVALAVSEADLVVFAVPVLAMGPAALQAASGLKAGAIVTDVGSVKGSVAEALLAAAPEHAFVIPGHPIAGTERSGPDAGFAELFEKRWVILTPQDRTDTPYLDAIQKLTTFWTALGANVECMDAAHHDLVLAVTSHLPHLIAYNIVGTAADMEEVTQAEVMKYSAGGFRDFTRIAASDPTMWRDVFVANKDAVLEILGRFTEDLQALSRAIRWGNRTSCSSCSAGPAKSAGASSPPARKAPSPTSAATGTSSKAPMNGYVWLSIAIMAEVVATTFLKASEGFTRPIPAIITTLGYGLAFWCLSHAMKTVPVGVGYAIWSGVGIIAITAIAWIWFRQRPDLPAMVGMGLILAGVLVINLFSKSQA